MGKKRKRANGEGTCRQRNDGRWEYKAMVGCKLGGSPQLKSFYGKTQAEAKRSLRSSRSNGMRASF